jgi:DNA-binding PadR family transcriptional regulator
MNPDPTGFLPLPAPAFHILVSLADQSRHGYGIMLEVASRTDNEVRLNPGTLYTTIKRLLDSDLISEIDPPHGSDSTDERRRYYKITALGRRVARAELARLAGMVRQAAAALEG